MKAEQRFLRGFISVVICLLMIGSSFLFGDEISVAVYDGAVKIDGFRAAFGTQIDENMSSFSENKAAFSFTGFGGGGYESRKITDTPEDILDIKKEAEKIYSGLKKSGEISEQQLGGGNASYGFVKVNNRTDEKIDIRSLLNQRPEYDKITRKEPYILVYHTHTTEGYELLDKGWYSKEYNSRTTDERKNMLRVGDELVGYLEEAGFKVIHDRNIYDKSYNGAYDRSLVTVKKYLKKYPSIRITLDVHRDAIHYESGTKCKPTALINGKKAAQVMIISGCEGGGVEGFPQWQKNLVFATALHNAVEEKNRGLMRPIFFCHRKYNMNVTPCSLLLEFGTDANTLEEAVYSAALVGEALGRMLNKELEK